MGDETQRPRFDTATGRKILGYDQQTGQPIFEQPQSKPAVLSDRAWWSRQSDQTRMLLMVGGVVVVVVVVLAALGRSGGSGPRLTGVVHGQMVGAGNVGSSNSLTWSHVYCGWEGDHVEVHADLTDGLSVDPVRTVSEDVTISPIYTIRLSDGSEQRHGDGIFSTIDVQVPASKTVSWWGNAGQPEGIKQGAPIGSCVPEVMDVTR